MNKTQSTIYNIIVTAITAALFFVLDALATMITIGPLKISFSGLPLVICALIITDKKALYTCLAAFIGSFVSQLYMYGLCSTTILWILPHVIRALLLGLFFEDKIYKTHPVRYFIILIGSGLVLSLLNTGVTYLDALIIGYDAGALIFGVLMLKLLTITVNSVIYGIISPLVAEALAKIRRK